MDEIKKISIRFNIPEAEIRKLLSSEIKERKKKVNKQVKQKRTHKPTPEEHQSTTSEFYFFSESEYSFLLKQIEVIEKEIGDLGKEMGQSCQEGAETFHDNFAYEEGIRQQRMWSNQLQGLKSIRNKAKIIDYNNRDLSRVSIGSLVTVKDNTNGNISSFRIGGYITIDRQTLSYKAPMSKLLVGSQKGDLREGKINGRQQSYEVLNIE